MSLRIHYYTELAGGEIQWWSETSSLLMAFPRWASDNSAQWVWLQNLRRIRRGNPVIFKWHLTILHCRGSKMYFQSYFDKIGLSLNKIHRYLTKYECNRGPLKWRPLEAMHFSLSLLLLARCRSCCRSCKRIFTFLSTASSKNLSPNPTMGWEGFYCYGDNGYKQSTINWMSHHLWWISISSLPSFWICSKWSNKRVWMLP